MCVFLMIWSGFVPRRNSATFHRHQRFFLKLEFSSLGSPQSLSILSQCTLFVNIPRVIKPVISDNMQTKLHCIQQYYFQFVFAVRPWRFFKNSASVEQHTQAAFTLEARAHLDIGTRQCFVQTLDTINCQYTCESKAVLANPVGINNNAERKSSCDLSIYKDKKVYILKQIIQLSLVFEIHEQCV